MKRVLRWIGGTVAVLVILLLAAAVILPLVFDPNDHKERIEAQASAALGRVVHLEGPIGWSVFPWLAIDLHQVTVSNASGFQQALLMQVERASARVRLLPLLRREIEIGTIALDAPELNLEIDGDGRNNWDSIGGEGGESDGGFGGKLVVAGIRIDNGRVNYADRAAGIAARLSALSLSTGEIAPGQPVEADLEFDLELPDSGVEGSLSTRSTLTGVLGGGPLSAVLDRLEFSGRAGAMPLALELAEPAVLDGAADKFSAPAVVFESGGMTLRTDLGATGLSAEPALAGHLEVGQFNARRWLKEAFDFDPESADSAALTRVSLSADWSARGDRAALKNLNVGLDDSTISGELSLSSIAAARGQFRLAIDRIDLDRYLPAEAAAETAADEDLLAGLEFGNLTGEVAVDELKLAGMTATNLKVAVKSGAQGIDFDPLTAEFYGGKLNSAVAVRPGAPARTVTLRQDLSGIQAGPLFEDLFGRKVMTGIGNLSADIALDRPLAANPLASANGSIAYDFNDGQLFGVNVFGVVRQALALIGRAEEPADEDEDAEPVTDFSTMVMKARITNGIMETRELKLKSPVLEVGGDLSLNLADRSLQGTIEPAVLAAGAKAHGLDLGRLTGVPLPVSLSGTFDAPKIGLDPSKLLLASQRARLDDKKDDLLNRLLGSESKPRPAEGEVANDAETAGEEPAAEEESEPDKKSDVARGLFNSLLQSRDDEDRKEAAEEDDGSR